MFKYSDSAYAVQRGFPWTPVANIQFVTDSTTCAAAVAAFNDEMGTTGTAEADTAGYVFSLGGTGYAYVRPNSMTISNRRPVFLFNPTWVLVVTIDS
ncbi:MAG TPA: hypothetical protein PKA66_10865 [Gemmatimonadales bacterium]|nr:hypothetical protein [Gemmatimonadales bacterium]